MPSLKHLHIMKRMGKRSNSFYLNRYRCIDPDCTFTQRAELLEGKRCICPICLRPEGFIMPRVQLFNSVPRCSFCSGSKKVRALAEVANDLESMLTGAEFGLFSSDGTENKDGSGPGEAE